MTSPKIRLVPSKAKIEELYPISEQIAKALTIDGIWLAGLSVLRLPDKQIGGKVRRVLLPAPSAEILPELQSWTVNPLADYGSEVTRNTARAQQLGAQVKWLKFFPGFTLLLANANGNDGWAHLEILLPYVESDDRPFLRVERKNNPALFEQLKATFDALWKSAIKPS